MANDVQMPGSALDPVPGGSALKRIILEMGTGNDLYGEDYTKAAIRAVHDALHHSSITLFRSLHIDSATMQVLVTVGVQKPEEVDLERVAAELPRGQATVRAVKGGLNIEDHEHDIVTVIATVGIDARIPIPNSISSGQS